MSLPQAQSVVAVAEAQRMFRAVLAPWASDLLELRRRGLDQPGFRREHRLALRPVSLGCAGVARSGRRSAGDAPGAPDPERRAA